MRSAGRAALAASLVLVGCDCTGEPPSGGRPDGGSITGDVELVSARGDRIGAVFATPSGDGPFPAVLMMHGSGGLYRMPEDEDEAAGRTCSPRLESQFEAWRDRLVASGYAVLMPDSFSSRGFCDYNDDDRVEDAYPPIPGDTDGKGRRLLDRIYDLAAATRFLEDHPDIDASRTAWVGFSNGASTVALGLHHVLRETLAERDDGTGLDEELGVPIPTLPVAAVPPRFVVAYYPGCGFDGLLDFSTDAEDLERFYYPVSPLFIEHASEDPLLDDCSVTQEGTRELQADAYAEARGVPDHYTIRIHAGADHGFDDGARCEDDADAPDVAACVAARDATLARLEDLLAP